MQDKKKKTKKESKVRDLKPKKDAKGGGHTLQGHTLQGRHIQAPHGNR